MPEGKGRILIVDDTVDTVELLRKRLRAEGYDTAEAFDGEECLSKVPDYEPDLIILDIMMPKLNGYEVCHRLKNCENTRYIPILMLTAKSETSDKVKGLDIGADDYISKPFDYKELSARVRSLLNIKAAREKLVKEEKSDALSLMMDEVAHEVRNPLVSIGGFARRVHDNLPEGNPNRKYMEMIIEDVGRLENILRQLIEMQTMSLSFLEPTDINNVVAKALDLHGEEMEEKDVTLETEYMKEPPVILADKEQLMRAFSNLIQNALDALTAQVRIVRITTRTSEGRVEVEISDTGRGISRETMKKIFDPLFTSKVYGPGLGLTFALKIVQEHRGAISMESEPGKGTTVIVRLPVKKG